MYEAYYKLSSDPFRLLPDPSVCYPHRSCAKAWAYLRYALKRGEGIVVVTGPPGSGKTTLAERLLNEINPAKTVSAHLVANDLNATDLLRKLAYSLGLAAEGLDRAMLAFRIERYLIELEHSSRRALVVIDEAQTLSHQSLEAVRLLTVAPPPSPTPPAPVTPSLPPTAPTPVPAGRPAPKPPVIVQESAAADLESVQARALLDDLHAKLDSDTDLRLSISWRLEKPGSSK